MRFIKGLNSDNEVILVNLQSVLQIRIPEKINSAQFLTAPGVWVWLDKNTISIVDINNELMEALQ